MFGRKQTVPQPITLLAVRQVMADCLGLELEQVTATGSFYDELGGDDSIELIDLSFRLEKEFQIQEPLRSLNRYELWELDSSGRLTPAALEVIKLEFPFLTSDQLEPKTGPFTPPSLITAEFLYQLLTHVKQSETRN